MGSRGASRRFWGIQGGLRSMQGQSVERRCHCGLAFTVATAASLKRYCGYTCANQAYRARRRSSSVAIPTYETVKDLTE